MTRRLRAGVCSGRRDLPIPAPRGHPLPVRKGDRSETQPVNLPLWKWVLDVSPERAANTVLPAYDNPGRIEIASFGGPIGKSMVLMTNGPSQTVEITGRE